MENFFYNDEFYSSIEDLINKIVDEDDEVKNLPDDWNIQIELSEEKPIIQFNSEMLSQLVQDDMLSEDQGELEDLQKVLKKYPIDFEKINSEVPRLYYPNGKTDIILKQDLLEYIN